MTNVLESHSFLVLHISGTFDVAVARNQLRKFAAKHKLPSLLRARAAAATTTIASVILFRSSDYNASLELTVTLVEDDGIEGVKFEFNAALTDDINKRFVVSEWQLERACDEINISNHGDHDQVMMTIWMKRR